MNKMAMKWGLAGALLGAMVAWSSGAAAQQIADNPPVEIRNTSGETRKVCFHKDKAITLFAIGCVVLKDGENILWNRDNEFTPFQVKVYRPQLLDKHLYTRSLPMDTGKIILGTGARFGFSRFENVAKRFTVRVCNTQHDDPVYFALGLDYATMMLSEGWWSLEKGECKDIPITKRAKDNWNIPASRIPRVYYYARTYGDEPLYWNKGDDVREFCLNPGKAFKGYLGGGQSCAQDAQAQTYRFLAALNDRSAQMQYLSF